MLASWYTVPKTVTMIIIVFYFNEKCSVSYDGAQQKSYEILHKNIYNTKFESLFLYIKLKKCVK